MLKKSKMKGFTYKTELLRLLSPLFHLNLGITCFSKQASGQSNFNPGFWKACVFARDKGSWTVK